MDQINREYATSDWIKPFSVKLIRPSASSLKRGYIYFAVAPVGTQMKNWSLLIGDDINFYMISIAPTRLEFFYDPSDAEVLEGNKFDFFTHAFPMMISRWRKSALNYSGIVMFPNGPITRVRTYRKLLSFIKRCGLSPSSQLFSNHPELVEGFAISKESRPIVHKSDHPKIAVCLHLYYTELWDEIENLLSKWDISFHLFLTINAENSLLCNAVRRAFPNSTIFVVANKGRDVRPFLTILDAGLLSKFDLVCKIHGKKSSDGNRIGIFGDVLRRAIFFDLIYPISQVWKVLQVFKDCPRVGIVGPKRLLVSARDAKKRDVFGQNREIAEGLIDRMGGDAGTADLDFFEGTMFWARPEALQPLRELGLSFDFFDAEAGKLDGAPEHALERLFNHSARIAAFEVVAISSSLFDDIP